MRLHQLVCVLVLCALGCGCGGGTLGPCSSIVPAGQPGSCPIATLQPGTQQAYCRTGNVAPCDEGLTCINSACIPCGYDTGPCCWVLNGGQQCNPGITCDPTTDNDWDTCTASCGAIGLACCADRTCPAGGTCGDDNTCGASTSGLCSGDTTHVVWLVNEFGCASQPLTFSSGDDDAQTCAQKALDQQDPLHKFHLGPLDTAATCTDACSHSLLGNGAYSLCYFSAADLTTCEQGVCGQETCTWTDGACPP